MLFWVAFAGDGATVGAGATAGVTCLTGATGADGATGAVAWANAATETKPANRAMSSFFIFNEFLKKKTR
jgi:hypothetical protein